MGPLLFILSVIFVSLRIACSVSQEVTWFTYYLGVMIGLLISSMILEIWNKKTKKGEKLALPSYEL